MASKKLAQTPGAWVPTDDQARVIDLLAQGYSQSAVARIATVSQPLISYWVNHAVFAEQFRVHVAERAKLFRENLQAIEDQQIVLATAVICKALEGQLDEDGGKRTIQYDAAVELLRSTRWKQRAGEAHKF